MKRILSFIAGILLLLGLTSCTLFAKSPKSATYTGTQNVEGREYDIGFSYDEEMLLSYDTKEYNPEVGVLLSVMAIDIYDTDSTVLDGYEGKSIYDALGFQSKKIVMDSEDYETDPLDISTFILAKKRINCEGTVKTLLFVVLQGSNKSVAFWKSNLDVGCDSEEYYAMTGEHPEWDDKKVHKGFYVTSQRIEKEIDSYIGKNAENLTMIITGHSRGGALANILGMHYETETDYRTSTYTFASPNTVDKGNYPCDTVFNVLNEDDLIPTIPPTFWGMERYGTDVVLNMNDYASSYESLFSLSYNTCNPDAVTEYLKELAPTRNSLYTYIEGDAGESYYDFYIIESNEESGKKHLEDCLKREGLLQYAKVYIKDGTIDYLCIRLSPAFMINFAVNVAFDDSPVAYFANRSTYLTTDYYGFIYDLYQDISTDGVYDAHIESTYYLLAVLLNQ